jgi:carbon storage regulator
MLVLSRKVGESLVIDGGIVLRVLSTQGGRIRLGVDAPATVSIRRSELQLSSKESPEAASVACGAE